MKDAACCSHISLRLRFREHRAFSTETRQVDLGACPPMWAPPPPAPAGSWERARGAGLPQMQSIPQRVGNSADTQAGSTTSQLLRAQGLCLCALSSSPSWLLRLEIRELLLISRRPCTWPRTRGAPLSVLLTGEMTKPGVTFTLRLAGSRLGLRLVGVSLLKHLSTQTRVSQDASQTPAGARVWFLARTLCLMRMGRGNAARVCVHVYVCARGGEGKACQPCLC